MGCASVGEKRLLMNMKTFAFKVKVSEVQRWHKKEDVNSNIISMINPHNLLYWGVCFVQGKDVYRYQHQDV